MFKTWEECGENLETLLLRRRVDEIYRLADSAGNGRMIHDLRNYALTVGSCIQHFDKFQISSIQEIEILLTATENIVRAALSGGEIGKGSSLYLARKDAYEPILRVTRKYIDDNKY